MAEPVIEIAREGDILPEGQDSDECDKNPGHSRFYLFNEIAEEHIPQEDRSAETLQRIKRWGDRVVRLVIHMEDGPKWTATGYVVKNDNGYLIKTNHHVVKDDNEVQHCTVEFNYDSHDRSNVKFSKGVELLATCPNRDVSLFNFDPVHDFVNQLHVEKPSDCPQYIVMYRNHAIEKHILNAAEGLWYDFEDKTFQHCIYTTHNLNDPLIEIMFVFFYDIGVSYLKSCYFRFNPIHPNIQELLKSSIEIHINNDDGSSRMIPGYVERFGDEYVVALPSDSIFNDEVKKCRLEWNGEVIGYGTRLYFEKKKSRQFLSDLSDDDYELYMQPPSDFVWLFEVHPLPRHVVKDMEKKRGSEYVGGIMSIMCCISHPHGGRKKVTFGRYLERCLQRFDSQGERIDQPGEDDSEFPEVSCAKYSCNTCLGSSGGPVFFPNSVYKMSNAMTHFMGEKVESILPNGELINNIGTAWG